MSKLTGIEMIAEERQRQLEIERWDANHDSQHTAEELRCAGIWYAMDKQEQEAFLMSGESMWPVTWGHKWYKPTTRIRDLVKAAALIAAEIDRLEALNKTTDDK